MSFHPTFAKAWSIIGETKIFVWGIWGTRDDREIHVVGNWGFSM